MTWWILSGPPARPGGATRYGRAISRGELARLFVHLDYFGTEENALRHIAAQENETVATLAKRWKDYSLGRHVMWATFDPQGGGPFDFAASAADVRGILGMDDGGSLLLLEYDLGLAVPRHPTVADAYAGSRWTPHFRAAGESEIARGFGLTQVWEALAHDHAGRPEIVHEPITGERLLRVPREIA